MLPVNKLIPEIKRLKLIVPDRFEKFSEEELEKRWNGIGADWMSKWARESLSSYLELFQPAALIHDVGYSMLNKNDPSLEIQREACDDQFFENCKSIVKDKYSIFNPVYYLRLRDAHACYLAVRKYGRLCFI